MAKFKSSFVMSPEGQQHLASLSKNLGVSKSAVLELAVRAYVPPGGATAGAHGVAARPGGARHA